jgi:hypothetical protein
VTKIYTYPEPTRTPHSASPQIAVAALLLVAMDHHYVASTDCFSRYQRCAVFADLRSGAKSAAASHSAVSECGSRKSKQVANDQQPIGKGLDDPVPINVESSTVALDVGSDLAGIGTGGIRGQGVLG